MERITSDELQALIRQSTAESVYVDFKQKWHDDNALLVLDILCLSNADYQGDRFILIGIDNNAKAIGILSENTSNRKDSAEVFNVLRNSCVNRLPKLDVYTLSLGSKNIDIVHITNDFHKPFFLTKDKKFKRGIIRAGVVYSRNGSANTPINGTATDTEIEKMWRDRLGLEQTPLERCKQYLADPEGWGRNFEFIQYYKQFPEFTIKVIEDEDVYSDQEWARTCSREIDYRYELPNFANLTGIFYHQTLLYEIIVVIFDNQDKMMVAPHWKFVGKGRFYFYIKDSIDYSYQKYLSNAKGKDDSRELKKIDSYDNFSIPVFDNYQSLESFLTFSGGKVERNFSDYLRETEPNEQNAIFYDLLDQYENWKKLSVDL